MLKRLVSAFAFLLFVIPAANAFDQDAVVAAGRWWRNERFVQRIGLATEQVEKLDAAFQESRLKMIRLKGDVEAARFELETLVEEPVLDEDAIMAQYAKLERAHAALGRERFDFFLTVRKIVGYENYQKLIVAKKLKDRKRGDR